MSLETSTSDVIEPVRGVGRWIGCLPDGAVSVAAQDDTLVLRASDKLQQEFESLLARHKTGTLSSAERRQYDAICELDEALSWLNRLARSPEQQG